MTIWLLLSLAATLIVLADLRSRNLSFGRTFFFIPLAFAVVLLGLPHLWAAVASGYAGDSFWTLRATGRVGVVVISAVGIALLFLLLAWKSRAFLRVPWPIGLPLDILAGLGIFTLAFSLSPQLYYTFYRFIFPNLPNQNVVSGILDFDRVLLVARILPGGSMADHLSGVTFWAVIPYTIWVHVGGRKNVHPQRW